MRFYSLVVLLLVSVHETIIMIYVMVLFLVSVIYKVFLSVKDSMLLYELKMVIYIDIHLAINTMC